MLSCPRISRTNIAFSDVRAACDARLPGGNRCCDNLCLQVIHGLRKASSVVARGICMSFSWYLRLLLLLLSIILGGKKSPLEIEMGFRRRRQKPRQILSRGKRRKSIEGGNQHLYGLRLRPVADGRKGKKALAACQKRPKGAFMASCGFRARYESGRSPPPASLLRKGLPACWKGLLRSH